MNINERLDLIKPKLLDKDFLRGRGLGNEINFWIFDYSPEDELLVRSHIDYLMNTTSNSSDIRIVHYDLYDVMIDALNDKGYLGKIVDMESSRGSETIINPIKKTLRTTLPDDIIINTICEKINTETDIILLSGIGKAWPIIRSHTVLNNLHSKLDTTPLVMFFPGTYEGSLKLFDEITDDNYYRAFKLV